MSRQRCGRHPSPVPSSALRTICCCRASRGGPEALLRRARRGARHRWQRRGPFLPRTPASPWPRRGTPLSRTPRRARTPRRPGDSANGGAPRRRRTAASRTRPRGPVRHTHRSTIVRLRRGRRYREADETAGRSWTNGTTPVGGTAALRGLAEHSATTSARAPRWPSGPAAAPATGARAQRCRASSPVGSHPLHAGCGRPHRSD